MKEMILLAPAATLLYLALIVGTIIEYSKIPATTATDEKTIQEDFEYHMICIGGMKYIIVPTADKGIYTLTYTDQKCDTVQLSQVD